MSFATGLALLVGLLVALPVVAHLLRRGRTRVFDFPPAALVPQAAIKSNQRRRLDDKVLLALRAAMLLALAVLGATPLVKCSHLAVARNQGASVALAIVVDDSHSMQAREDGTTRFQRALNGAAQLLDSARSGDAVAIVLAGKPARILLSATTELGAADAALRSLRVSDRGTDLTEALQLARQALEGLPHADKRVIVLSDTEANDLPDPAPGTRFALPELAKPLGNCGIASASASGPSIVVSIGCNTPEAARGRRLELVLRDAQQAPVQAQLDLDPVPGPQRLALSRGDLGFALAVRLSGADSIASDDRAPVGPEPPRETVAIVADPANASALTGGPTVVEQAFAALAPQVTLRPLSSVPESAEDLANCDALVLDDPPGLSPDARSAVTTWLEGGRAALALLGPAAAGAQLAASLEPFARQGATWEAHDKSLDQSSLAWLGAAAATLDSIGAPGPGNGRLRLDTAALPQTQVVGAWEDGVPWLLRRPVGAGLLFTAGLPASVEHSDLALRPGFLALLDTLLRESRNRAGTARADVGSQWLFPESKQVRVAGPGGVVTPEELEVDGQRRKAFTPVLAGAYTLTIDGAESERVAILSLDELTGRAQPLGPGQQSAQYTGAAQAVDASPQWALVVLGLFALELFARAFGSALLAKWSRA